jgi:hypothetical protein
MANEPVQAPPSSVAPAKSISAAELSAELSAPKAAPAPRAPDPRAPELPPVKEQESSPPRPDYRDGLRNRVKESAPKEEAKPEPEKPRKYLPKAEPVAEVAEKKAPVSADDAPPAKPDPTPDVVPDDHKRVLPHDKPDTAKRIKAILAEREAAQKERDAAKAELEAAKKAPSTPPEELTKLRQEYDAAQSDLMRYRRLHDIENDKEFAAKYREPVKQVEASIEAALKRNKFTDGHIEIIRKAGGLAAFSNSNQSFLFKEPDPNNEGQTRDVYRSAAQVSRDWINALTPADAALVQASLGKQQLLQEEEKNAIAAAQNEAKTYFEGQTAAQRQQAEAATQAQQKTLKEYQDWLKEANEKTEWLKDRAVPDNASEEQKAEITRHNEFNAQLRDRLKKDPTNAKEYGELKLEAAESHHLRRTLGEKDARIAELEAQLSKSKSALRTTPKGGSLLKSDTAPKEKDGINAKDPTNFRDGLRKRMLAASGSGEE